MDGAGGGAGLFSQDWQAEFRGLPPFARKNRWMGARLSKQKALYIDRPV